MPVRRQYSALAMDVLSSCYLPVFTPVMVLPGWEADWNMRHAPRDNNGQSLAVERAVIMGYHNESGQDAYDFDDLTNPPRPSMVRRRYWGVKRQFLRPLPVDPHDMTRLDHALKSGETIICVPRPGGPKWAQLKSRLRASVWIGGEPWFYIESPLPLLSHWLTQSQLTAAYNGATLKLTGDGTASN